MVIRIWRAKATTEGAEKYQHHFEQRVIPELQALTGFAGAYLLDGLPVGASTTSALATNGPLHQPVLDLFKT